MNEGRKLERCSHCHLQYNKDMLKQVSLQNGEILYFCCNGCESVYFLLQKANLQSFYDKKGKTTLKPPSQNIQEDLAFFDSVAFRDKYIRKAQGGFSACSLILTDIHCAACVWLNEKILNTQKGIKSASINYTNNRLLLIWDSKEISLSQIVRLIRSIGYNAYAYDPKLQESRDKKQTKEYYIRVIVALFCTMNIMWIAVAQWSGYFSGISREASDILNIASFLLCSIALFYSGFVFYRGAYYGLKNGFVGMDLLVSVGSSLTFCYSIYAAITHSGETYFESVSMIITFVLIGKFLEVRSKKSAGESLDMLNAFLPQSVSVCEGGNESKILIKKPEEVQVGECIMALPGEKIAIDGILQSENGLFDTKAINGESLPVQKLKGEEIFSGFVALNQKILYSTTKSFKESLMSKVLQLVEESLIHRPHIQNLANRLSQNFSRTILAIAFLCFLGWHFVGDLDIEHSVIIGISVIIIACPCALALATPIATVVGIAQSYKKNIIFKQASFLETLAKASVVVFDKTGTLTEGKPKVFKEHLFSPVNKSVVCNVIAKTHKQSKVDSQYLPILYALVSLSKHPISKSIVEFLDTSFPTTQTPTQIHIQDFKQVDSQGIEGYYEGRKIYGGSLAFLRAQNIHIPPIALGDGMIFGFALQSKIIAVYELEDSLKSYANELIAYLQRQNVRLALLSGDREQSVDKIASMVGIKEFYATQSPLQKGAFIQSLRQNGEVVVMVGDGINDALALSKSDIAISMGAGSDMAILSSDVVILDDSLKSLKDAFILAKKTFGTIKQNIIISICYNALTIPIALCGLIIPLFAALSMSLSSIIVVLNSLRIKRI